MNSIFKKTVAVVLAVVMLMSIMSTAVFATTFQGQETTQLVLDEQKTVTFERGESKYFSFTPEKTGNYVFESFADEDIDAEAYLYDSWEEQVGSNEGGCDDGEGYNFYFEYYLTAGETYYLQVYVIASEFDVVPIMVTKGEKSIADIKFDTVNIDAFKNGYFYGENDKYHYEYHNWYKNIESVTAVFSDDSEQEYPIELESEWSNRAWFEIGDKSYYIDFGYYSDGDFATNDWLPGTTHIETVTWTYGHAELEVKIGEAQEVELDDTIDFDWSYENQTTAYLLKPEKSGLYSFVPDEVWGTMVSIYDKDFKRISYMYAGDQDKFNCYLKANETYYISISMDEVCEGEEGTFSVYTQEIESTVESISFKPITITEGTNCFQDGEGYVGDEYIKYFSYYWWERLSYEVEYTNGHSSGQSGVTFYDDDDNRYELIVDRTSPSYENRWLPGNTYYVTVEFMGEEYEVPVTIEASPFEKVEILPVTVYEDFTEGEWNGSYDYENEEPVEYFHYDWKPKYKITTTDGEVIEGQDYGFEYNGDWYYFNREDNQYEVCGWKVGETHQGEVGFLGKIYNVSITVEENPIKKIEIDPVTVEENKDGYWSLRWNENDEEVEYYRYQYANKISYKITLKNNEVITGTAKDNEGMGYIELFGTRFYIDTDDTQYTNPWEKGKTYDATIRIGANEIPIKVTVKERTYKSLVLNQETEIKVSSQEEHYLFTPSTTGLYIFESFSQGEDPVVKLYDQDFNQIDQADDNGEGSNEYDFILEHKLEAGKKYYFGVRNYNGDATINVKLTKFESPIKSIVFQPLNLKENVDGYYVYDENDQKYFEYNHSENLTYTITYKDGTTFTETGLGFYDNNGKWVSMDYVDNQYQQHWQAGKTYDVKITVYGVEYTAKVSIIADPIKSIEIDPITVEFLDGYWKDYYDEENDIYNEYYHYEYYDKLKGYTIKLKNGTSVKGEFVWDYQWGGPKMIYDGQGYYVIDWHDTQSTTPWKVGGTYQVTVDVMGKQVPVTVNVKASNPTNLTLDKFAIATSGKVSHFAFTPTQDGTYVFESNSSGADPYVELCDSQNMYIDYADDQEESYDFKLICNLEAGQTYYFHVGTNGQSNVKFNVKLTKLEDIIEDIKFNKIKVYNRIDNIDFESFDSTCLTEYYYNYKISYTITFKDGTVKSFTGDQFEYDGNVYKLKFYDSQWEGDGEGTGYGWEVGETYDITIAVLGKTYSTQVEVLDNPIDYVVAQPIVIPENTGGYWEDGIDDYYYEWYRDDFLKYTIYLNDGTEIKGQGRYFEFEGREHRAFTTDYQWDEPWCSGNMYYEEISVLDQVATVEIEISQENMEDGFEYLVQNGEAIITGVYYDFEPLEIPEELGGYPVTAIASLDEYLYSKEIIIPDSVTKLSDNMFQGNSVVEKISIGSGVEALNNKIFQNAYGLKEIVISADNAEYTSVDGIVYDKDVTKMVAIPGNKETTHILPATVTDIELYINGAYKFALDFSDNDKTGYIWEDGILYDENKTVIYSCSPDKTGEYVMPNSVETISNKAFENSALTSVTVSNNVKEIVYYAFAGSSELETVVLPDTLNSISYGAFENCKMLNKINIPSQLKTLGTRAFKNSGILEATIPSGVKEIGAEAFWGSNLMKVTLSEGLVGIGTSAFDGTNITKIDLPQTLEVIDAYAFYNTDISSVAFGPNLYEIGKAAFAQTKLQSVTIPDNVLMIGEDAFAGVPAKNLTLSQNATYLSEAAFCNMDIQSVDIPDSVTDIAYRCFENCENLMNIDLPQNLEALGYAFHGTKWYNSQPNGAVYIENAFYHYKGTMAANTEFQVKSGTKIIAEYAFNGQKNLKSVYIPKSVKSIGSHIFEGCGDVIINYEGSPADKNQMRIDDEIVYGMRWNYNACMHTWANATCKADKTCTKCKATVSGTKLKTHSNTNISTKATLTKNGSIVTKCSVCGTVAKTTIIAKIASVTTTAKITYNGKTKTPAVTVKDANGKVISSANYTVKYASGRKNYGKYKITVTFKGNYSGSKAIYFEIVPKNTKISKITAKKKSLVVNVKKEKSVSGYEIQYSLNKNFKSAKTVTLKKNSTTSKTIKKLKAKKTYYVRVRTYKTYKGKKYYSNWSSAKKQKTK